VNAQQINLSEIMRREGIEKIVLGVADLFTVVFKNGKIGTGKSIRECKEKAS
jgi:hypothetical protein